MPPYMCYKLARDRYYPQKKCQIDMNNIQKSVNFILSYSQKNVRFGFDNKIK